jgi:hypothetical protein
MVLKNLNLVIAICSDVCVVCCLTWIQKLAQQFTQSDVAEGSRHEDDACQSIQTESNEVLAMSVAEPGEGATNVPPPDADTSASSSVEFASLCGSVDTLHSAGENWPPTSIAD